jgi:hypothetical protein
VGLDRGLNEGYGGGRYPYGNDLLGTGGGLNTYDRDIGDLGLGNLNIGNELGSTYGGGLGNYDDGLGLGGTRGGYGGYGGYGTSPYLGNDSLLNNSYGGGGLGGGLYNDTLDWDWMDSYNNNMPNENLYQYTDLLGFEDTLRENRLINDVEKQQLYV